MKKMHVILSALAVVLAAGSAFSTVESRRSVIHYQSTSPGANCDTQFQGEVCDAGTGLQCEVQGASTLYISQKVDGGNCEMLRRP